jgi:hypothetical protein
MTGLAALDDETVIPKEVGQASGDSARFAGSTRHAD